MCNGEVNKNRELKKKVMAHKWNPKLGHSEIIRVIKLNVRIGNIIVRDQFQWDINNPNNYPEVVLYSIIN